MSEVRDGMRVGEKEDVGEVIKDFMCSDDGKGLSKYLYIW